MGFALGDNVVGKNGSDFAEDVKIRNYRISASQIMTKNLVMSLAYEAIADEGYLNNPYRSVRFLDPSTSLGYGFQQEIYPGIRTSNAIALRGRYFLEQRVAIHAGYRLFGDSWGITANTLELGYTLAFDDYLIVTPAFDITSKPRPIFTAIYFHFVTRKTFSRAIRN